MNNLKKSGIVDDPRSRALVQWACSAVAGQISADAVPVRVSDDASFRRYFRISGANGLVFVDAPPEHEDNPSFIRIARALGQAGLNAPQVTGYDLEKGFMAISDLGDRIYLDVMRERPSEVPSIYQLAVDALVKMQTVECELPVYDRTRLLAEMALFHEWFLSQQLEMSLSVDDRMLLESAYELLVDNALDQPACFVHRDYHCRNLMICGEKTPGIIDFQDAVTGPVTYDLVSLYKDCYYRFDRPVVEAAVSDFADRLMESGTIRHGDPVLRWFDLMGVQRHLKCAGIFSRLNLRDGKPRYLDDIALVLEYLREAAAIYGDLAAFGKWLDQRVIPLARDAGLAR